VVDELEAQGVLLEALADEVSKKLGKDYDPFDLICHVAFDRPPLSRRERAEQIKKHDIFMKYGEPARRVLDALLNKYADAGILAIETLDALQLAPVSNFGTPMEIVSLFGGKMQYITALHDLEKAIYSIQPAAA
jgi:type I restriction enzyme R subunit